MAADEITVTIDSLGYGVFGVARTDRGVVFVPGTAPGDVVRVRLVADRRGHHEAEVRELVAPSPLRRVPPCRFVPECGGCTWQHVDYPAQLAAKERILRELLARIGRFDPARLDLRPIVASPEWAYRQRITLRVDGEQRMGFYQHHSRRLVEIDACRIANRAVNAHLAAAREWLRGVSTTVRRVEIASSHAERVAFVANAEGPFRHDAEYHERFLRGHPTVAGIVLFGRGWRHSFGAPITAIEVEDGLSIESEGGFSQVNPQANRRLVAIVLELGAPRETDGVLDLYCGAGNLTLPLARRAGRVLGVESDPVSIGYARRNADRWRLGNCRFVQRGAAPAAKALAAEGEPFDLVVLDPPRSGAADVVETIAALRARRLVYVSCDPATLARDLRRLAELGFTLGQIQPIDLFPQTFHLETVVRLERAPGSPPAPSGAA